MASSMSMSSQLVAVILASIVAVASAGFGPSADGEWTDADLVSYSVVGGVAGAILLVAIMLYCQLQNFIKVGKIEEHAQRKARHAVATQEAEIKSKQIAAQKDKARKDVAAQKANQKTK
ncbi:uncharacterized protein LOC115918450 [Strongylocentrotus purpuratus]|uniref:Uncharacterized protein n=1 Tax=Strongylocentrotus purpuratus TaxID=7668 RepID=A0A7M7SVP6_STRPU|nr:uncharacterized protein LOC115918450 [Strongylocentrotus purpuratus]|eukprot:XP_800519.1 PREDICTED: uncharacterized protein LOC588640 [Strongylocentrotus purpuratus]